MTDEQQKLIDKNVRLMYSFIKGKSEVVPHYLRDDFISDVALRFCSSAINFDKEKGFKFSTYAHGGFDMCYVDIQSRKQASYKRNNFVSQGEVEHILHNASEEEAEHIEDDILYSLISKANLTEREMKIIKGYYFDNRSMPDLGREIGLCKERISQIRKKALEKMRRAASKEKLSLADFYGH